MEGQFQTSFIPKRPLVPKTPTSSPHKTNFFMLAMIVILVTVVALAVGMFGYTAYLKNHISSLQSDLTADIQALQPSRINEMARLDSRMTSTQTLLNSHIALSSFFSFLSQATLKSVRFSSFSYSMVGQKITVTMTGQAQSFSGVALQADTFNQPTFRPYISNPVFSNLGLDKAGNVTFDLTATLNPSVYAYSKNLNGIPLTSSDINAVSTVGTGTTSNATSSKNH